MNKEKELYEKSKVISLVTHEGYLSWGIPRINDRNFDHLEYLPDYNKTKLLDLFGKQDFCMIDGSGRRVHVWKRTLKSGNIWILAGNKERGTSYNLETKIDWMEAQEFFEDLIEELK